MVHTSYVLTLLLVVLCLTQAFEVPATEIWARWKELHGKSYESSEKELLANLIFQNNLKTITVHNLKYDLGMFSFQLGLNEFSDMNPEEMRSKMNGFKKTSDDDVTEGTNFLPPSNMDLPDSVDWRDQGYVTPVKNQGQCGSCWAFSSTGALEGQHFKATGSLVSLSEQNLVDCVKNIAGCGGGWMDNAFAYVRDNGGIDTEECYPYETKEGECRFNKDCIGATCSGYTDIASGDEHQLKFASAAVGPISVAIDASHVSFHLYASGIYDEPKCGNTLATLDHAVLVVGYGISSDGVDYWIVKNSWGETWGIDGYIFMSRNKNDQCGIALAACFPLV